MFRVTLEMAGERIALAVHGAFDVARFRHRFGAYEVRPSERAACTLDVFIQPRARRIGPTEVESPGVQAWVTPQGIKLVREALSMFIANDGSAQAFVSEWPRAKALSYADDAGLADTPVRILLTQRLLERGDAMLVHASACARAGSGVVFAGVSGSGKTTLARMLPADDVLSDDQVAVRLHEDGTATLCAVPFVGAYGRSSPPREMPLGAIVLLDRARAGTLVEVPRSRAAVTLVACVPMYTRSPAIAARALDAVDRVVRRTTILRGSPDLGRPIDEWLALLDAPRA